MRKFTTRNLTIGAVIAAAYAALTLCLPAYGAIQVRLAEAFTVLPFLFPAAIPGVTVGCLVVNLLSPYGPVDIVCGTAASLIAAVWTARMKHKALAPLPPVICNGVIIGAMLAWYEVGFGPGFWSLAAVHGVTVGLGELVACYGLGLPLLMVLPRIPYFRTEISAARLQS
ncbi:MAG: QueT transporter family protein [Intestinimonas sp.]|jgi:uncharacterized membrane protein|nr:QueT transporter family protein [Intestinimonas sp.]